MNALSSIATSLAYHWQLQRSDGIGFAAIGHDRSVIIEGLEFRSDPALQPTEMTLANDLLGSGMSFRGAFSPDAISLEDLRQGRWAGASVTFAMSDWQAGDAGQVLCRGRLGKVVAAGPEFEGEIDLLPRRLGESPCPQTSPECRAQLGDDRCQVAMRTRTKRMSVLAANDLRIICESEVSDDYAFGRLRWLTGANCGFDQVIMAIQDGEIVLLDRPPSKVVTGDQALISQGCDGRLATCAGRFDNVANFRGEPHLPGTDSLLRYPGA